jgi:hypothetical protein
MPGITLAQAEAKLLMYMGLDDQLGVNTEVTISGTTFKRRDIQKQIEFWNNQVIRLSRTGGIRIMEVIPR